MTISDSDMMLAKLWASILIKRRPVSYNDPGMEAWRQDCETLLGADQDNPVRRAALRIIHGLSLEASEETKTGGGNCGASEPAMDATAAEDDLRRRLNESLNPNRHYGRGRVIKSVGGL